MDFNDFFNKRVISKASVEEVRAREGAHRISFAYAHRDQPKRSSAPHVGKFSLPFRDTIGTIFQSDTGLELFQSNFGGCWGNVPRRVEIRSAGVAV
jgi:hypothetical protein